MRGVHGHGKVPTGGQVELPAGGQVGVNRPGFDATSFFALVWIPGHDQAIK